MFEFEYDNFLDKYNGLKIVVRNTAGGAIVCYAINNDGVKSHDVFSEGVPGCYFVYYIMSSVNMAINGSSIEDSEYRTMKREEIKELARKQAEQFLLDYFQVEDMRDLVARDEFFDKPMFS